MSIIIPNWTADSLQSVVASIQQNRPADALGTLACILGNTDSQRLQDLSRRMVNGEPIRHPGN